MPQVPRLNSPQVQEQGFANVRQSTEGISEAFDTGASSVKLDKAIQGFANTAGRFYEEQKRRTDEMRFLDADLKASEAQNEIENQVKLMRGANSAGAHDFAESEWEKRTKGIKESLANDEQRAYLDKSLMVRKSSLNKVSQTHTAMEMDKYGDDLTASYLENARNDGISNHQDPERVQLSLFQQRAAVTKQLERKGIPVNSDVAKLAYEEIETKTHAAIIQAKIADNDDRGALDYFAKNEALITDPATKAKVKNFLEEGTLRGESQRQSDAILREYGGSPAAALAQARKIEEPKLRDETVRRIKDGIQDIKWARTLRSEDLQRNAANVLDQGGNMDDVVKRMGTAWTELPINDRENIKSYADKRKAGILKSDMNVYYNLMSKASDPNTRQEFLETNLMEFRKDLADTEFKEIVKLQTGGRKKDGSDKDDLTGFQTKDQILKTVLTQSGFDVSPKEGSGKADELAKFYARLNEEAREFQKNERRPMTKQETEAMAKELVAQHVVEKGWFWDTKLRGYQMERKSPTSMDASTPQSPKEIEVPADAEEQIKEALKMKGQEPTASRIRDLYQKNIARKERSARGK